MLHLREQLLVHAERISFFLSLVVRIFGIIQSQREPRPASATGQENPDGAGGIAFKIGVQLFFSGIRNCYHIKPPSLVFNQVSALTMFVNAILWACTFAPFSRRGAAEKRAHGKERIAR